MQPKDCSSTPSAMVSLPTGSCCGTRTQRANYASSGWLDCMEFKFTVQESWWRLTLWNRWQVCLANKQFIVQVLNLHHIKLVLDCLYTYQTHTVDGTLLTVITLFQTLFSTSPIHPHPLNDTTGTNKTRKPTEHTYLSTGKSLHTLLQGNSGSSSLAAPKYNLQPDENDEFCHICCLGVRSYIVSLCFCMLCIINWFYQYVVLKLKCCKLIKRFRQRLSNNKNNVFKFCREIWCVANRAQRPTMWNASVSLT